MMGGVGGPTQTLGWLCPDFSSSRVVMIWHFWGHFWLVQIAPRSLQMITNNPKSPKFSSPAAGYPFSLPIQYDWVQKGANDSRVAIHMTHLPYPYGGYITETR